MQYLLSNMKFTSSKLEYARDFIMVYFSIDSLEIPQMNIGVSRRTDGESESIVDDLVASDISSFITKAAQYGLNFSLVSYSRSYDTYNVTLTLDGVDEINFTLS
jgi:hypothetical protein